MQICDALKCDNKGMHRNFKSLSETKIVRKIATAGAGATTALTLLLFSTSPVAYCQNQQIKNIREAYFQCAFDQVLSEYSHLTQEQRNNAQAYFFVGQSYLRRHDIENAEDYLKKAQVSGLSREQQDRTSAALARIAVLKNLRPPFFHDYNLGNFKIRVFARDSAWSRNLSKQFPDFLLRAREAFGNDNFANVSFYLFEDRASYDKFFDSWTVEPKNILHRGTGGMQIVMYCRYYPTGKEVGANDINDLYFRVLHEYSHALCNTTYGDRFHMPQWLNEGMADYFGWKYKADGITQAREKLRQLGSQRMPGTYEAMCSQPQQDADLKYLIGDVMVSEIFANKPLSIYGQLIKTARANGGNFEAAIQNLTGQNPRDVYTRLLQTY